MKILRAETDTQFSEAAALFKHYAKFLNLDLEFQGFSKELVSLSTMYGPPKGALLLAKSQEHCVGCVGIREFGTDIAEIKRMYVCPDYRGRGIGHALTESFIAMAQQLDYRMIRLESLSYLEAAIGIYRQYGFKDIPAYRYNPYDNAVFLELTLR